MNQIANSNNLIEQNIENSTPPSADVSSGRQAPIEPLKESRYKPQKAELGLLGLVAILGVFFDRFIIALVMDQKEVHLTFFTSLFWGVYLVFFYILNWHQIAKQKLMWLLAVASLALCIHPLFFDYTSTYAILSFFVLPGVLMAHAQFSTQGYVLKQTAEMVKTWFVGVFFMPFSAVFKFFKVLGSLGNEGKNKTVKKIILSILLTIPLLFIIVPLLYSADEVFAYYLNQVLGQFDVGNFIGHSIIVFIFCIFAYSFLWNSRFGNKDKKQKGLVQTNRKKFDGFMSSIILGIIVSFYVLFCAVQFTFLFAGAGLPEGWSYSSYARNGFAQIIVISAINLIMFGIFIKYGEKKKYLTIMLTLLVATTTIILASGFVRLGLYIEVYGMTWLRLISFWFMVYLAVILVLALIRTYVEKIPLIGISAIILVCWYVILGYSNPDAFIVRYNLAVHPNSYKWVGENRYYLRALSDDGLVALLESGVEGKEMQQWIKVEIEERTPTYSLASRRLQKAFDSYNKNQDLEGHS